MMQLFKKFHERQNKIKIIRTCHNGEMMLGYNTAGLVKDKTDW